MSCRASRDWWAAWRARGSPPRLQTLPSDEESPFGMKTWLEYMRTIVHMSCTAHYRDWDEGLTDMGRWKPITDIFWNKAADRQEKLVHIIKLNLFKFTSIDGFIQSWLIRKHGEPVKVNSGHRQTLKLFPESQCFRVNCSWTQADTQRHSGIHFNIDEMKNSSTKWTIK